VEEVAKTPVREGQGIARSRGGVFIDTGTSATIEVRLVTTLERVGSTINVKDIMLVIALRPAVIETGGIRETVVISPTDSDAIGSVEGRAILVSSAAAKSPVGSGWYGGKSQYKTSNFATSTSTKVLVSSLNPQERLVSSFEANASRGGIPRRIFC